MNSRQQILVDRLNNTGHLSVVEQAKELAVTEMTIRRDLQLFEKDGIATRVHGGAVPRSPIPHGIDIMAKKPREPQIAIAKQAVKLLKPGSTVLFNVGTTVLQVAREIATLKIPLTVITNSLPVAIALYKSECQVILPGGTLRRQGLDLIGPLTLKNIDEYHVDVLITGCDGALPDEGFLPVTSIWRNSKENPLRYPIRLLLLLKVSNSAKKILRNSQILMKSTW